MMYRVIIKREALKELNHLPSEAVKSITQHIEILSENPRPQGCKKLKAGKIFGIFALDIIV